MRKVISFIEVSFQKEGVHKYPGVVDRPELQDQFYLQYPHRHIFFFNIKIQISHNDRELEFLNFKNWLQSLYSEKTLELDYLSCEMISDQLAEKINEKYPNRMIEISIKEDNENGSFALYEP